MTPAPQLVSFIPRLQIGDIKVRITVLSQNEPSSEQISSRYSLGKPGDDEFQVRRTQHLVLVGQDDDGPTGPTVTRRSVLLPPVLVLPRRNWNRGRWVR